MICPMINSANADIRFIVYYFINCKFNAIHRCAAAGIGFYITTSRMVVKSWFSTLMLLT